MRNRDWRYKGLEIKIELVSYSQEDNYFSKPNPLQLEKDYSRDQKENNTKDWEKIEKRVNQSKDSQSLEQEIKRRIRYTLEENKNIMSRYDHKI